MTDYVNPHAVTETTEFCHVCNTKPCKYGFAPDDQLIYPGWTWGDHRHMLNILIGLEAEDAAVRAASKKLDTIISRELSPEDYIMAPPKCPECLTLDGLPHDDDCKTGPPREAGGYQYLNDRFEPIHTTSVPLTDADALDYFYQVETMFQANNAFGATGYITRRELKGTKYEMMPFKFDVEAGEIVPLRGK